MTTLDRSDGAVPRRASRLGGLMPAPRSVLVTVLPLAALVGVWWLVADAIGNSLTLPGPRSTGDKLGELLGDGTLGDAFLYTLRNILLAYGLALVAGLTLGLALGRIRWLRQMLRGVVSFGFTAPKSAFYPAMLLVFGLGATSKVAFGFTLAFFQIVIATTAAAAQIEERLIWSARSLGTSRLGAFSSVVLPATAPGAMAGARVGLVGAIVGVFLGEMIAGANGLGQLMVRARTMLDSPTVYVCIVAVAVMAILLDALLVAAGNRLVGWSREER